MKTAQETKAETKKALSTGQRVALYKTKDLLDRAIKEAISNGQFQAELMLPEGLEYATTQGLVKVLADLGYSISLKNKIGYIGLNLIRMPRRVLTIGWK